VALDHKVSVRGNATWKQKGGEAEGECGTFTVHSAFKQACKVPANDGDVGEEGKAVVTSRVLFLTFSLFTCLTLSDHHPNQMEEAYYCFEQQPSLYDPCFQT
jgi:hypothetical protein